MSSAKFIENLDLSVFCVVSSTSENDKRSLLQTQKLVTDALDDFTYLEIGSDRGGTLVPYLRDPNCANVISVDLRPAMQPDERGTEFPYPVDGEERMLDSLRLELNSEEMSKLRTFRSDIGDLVPSDIPAVDVALVDGEHTNVACFSDADHLLEFINQDAIIIFHDSNLISDALQNFERMLLRLKQTHVTALLPDQVAVIGIGRFAAVVSQGLMPMSSDRASFFRNAQRARWQAIALEHASGEDVARLSERMATAEARAQSAERLAIAAHEAHQAILSSTSWKVTAPLRAATRTTRKWLKF